MWLLFITWHLPITQCTNRLNHKMLALKCCVFFFFFHFCHQTTAQQQQQQQHVVTCITKANDECDFQHEIIFFNLQLRFMEVHSLCDSLGFYARKNEKQFLKLKCVSKNCKIAITIAFFFIFFLSSKHLNGRRSNCVVIYIFSQDWSWRKSDFFFLSCYYYYYFVLHCKICQHFIIAISNSMNWRIVNVLCVLWLCMNMFWSFSMFIKINLLSTFNFSNL